MSLINQIKVPFTPPGHPDEISIEYFRNRLLFYLLLSTLCIGFVAYLPSVYFAYTYQFYGIIFIDTVAILFIATLFFLRNLSYRFRTVSLLGIYYILGLWLLLSVGPMGAGFLWLFMFTAMTGVLLGTRATYGALILNTTTVLAVGCLVYTRAFDWVEKFDDVLTFYIIIGVNFICINAIVTISISILLTRLNTTFDKEKKISSKLKHEIQNRILAEQESERLAAQLLHTRKMEALGTLAGGVAHDFNNILSSVMGYAELTQLDMASSDPLQKNLQNIVLACQRAKGITHQILTFSRQSESQKEPCDIRQLLDECCKLFQVGVPANINFIRKIEIKNEIIMADQSQIYQVVMNLCTNAMQAIDNQKEPSFCLW
jgi:signal transduction histidine kinase